MSETLLEQPVEQIKPAMVQRVPEEYPLNSHEAGEQLSEIEQLDGFIEERADRALRSCEFQETPELKEAIEGFYHDHYYLAGAINAAVEGRYDSEVFDAIMADSTIQVWERGIGSKYPFNSGEREYKSPNVRTASYRLALMAKDIRETGPQLTESEQGEAHFNLLRQCGVALQESLFLETSVGISTLDEEDRKTAEELADKVKEAAGGRYIWKVPSGSVSFFSGETVGKLIKHAQETFWSDTRHAGQLEFHASGNVGGINLHGLMSRNQQVRKSGNMYVQTVVNSGGGTMHSVVPHFSEFYGKGDYSIGDKGSTIAMPLIKIIQKAPFARDGQYASLQLKDANEDGKIPTPTLNGPTGRIGAGEWDTVGNEGRDRVFFASPDELSDKLPDDYELDLFDKTNKPATFIIDRTLPIHSQGRELHELGQGYGFPERLIIESGTEQAIKQLQEEYLHAYEQYGVVVPLRRGVFAQAFENMPVDQERGRASAKIYNRYVHGSERNTA